MDLVDASCTEILGFLSGGACVWLAVRRHILTWPIGLLNNASYFALFFDARLFADMALQAVYFALGCYGWWAWIARRDGSSAAITRMNRMEWIAVFVAIPATSPEAEA